MWSLEGVHSRAFCVLVARPHTSQDGHDVLILRHQSSRLLSRSNAFYTSPNLVRQVLVIEVDARSSTTLSLRAAPSKTRQYAQHLRRRMTVWARLSVLQSSLVASVAKTQLRW